MTYEGLRLRFLQYYREITKRHRHKKLQNTDFTIISNNCWGGVVYESYDLPKESPTVGMFFMASDYIKFLSDLHGYVGGNLTFIDPNESKWKDAKEVSEDKRFGTYPIGRLSNGHDAVEIFFLHYSNEGEAKAKWERRVRRIRWDKLIVKFNDQNGCTEEDIQNFDALPYAHKICFTVKEYPYPSVIKIRVPKNHTFVHSSYEPFHDGKYIQLTSIINTL